jgi:arsenate reductase
MAEGLMNARLSSDYIAYSAGTMPGAINPDAVQAMADIGIDISGARSKGLGEFDGWEFDLVVTVCDDAAETCPLLPGKEHMHRGFDDPSSFDGTEDEIRISVARVRDEIWSWMVEVFGEGSSDEYI